MRGARALADPVLAAILLLGAFFCFWNLDGRGLWQDEAVTAVLAQRTRALGVPLADDGVNPVSTELGRDRAADGVWNWSPWLPFYLCAAGLRALGAEAGARLPFALAAWLCLPAVYLLGLRVGGSRRAARYSALALVLSAPFLLHARQARGYSFAALCCAVLALCVEGVLEGDRRDVVLFVAFSVILFYTNDLVALVYVFSLFLSALTIGRLSRSAQLRLTASVAVAAAVCLPGIFYFRVFEHGAGLSVLSAPLRSARSLSYLFALVLPWPAALAARSLGVRSRRLLWSCLICAAVLGLSPWLFSRYLIALAPLGAALTGAALDALAARSRLLAAACLAALATTLPSAGFIRWAEPGSLHSPFLALTAEVLNGYPSCGRAAGEYLAARATPGQIVLTNYDDAVLQFYAPALRTRGGAQGPPWPADPDWMVLHPYELSRGSGRDFDVLNFARARLARGGYAVQPFVCRDPVLAGAPEPETHRFTAPTAGSSTVILRRAR